MGAMTQQQLASVLSGTTPFDADATPPKLSPPQAIAGIPKLAEAEGGLTGLGVDAASNNCIALGSLDGQIDEHSIEEQYGEVQKVCLLYLNPTYTEEAKKGCLGIYTYDQCAFRLQSMPMSTLSC